MTGHELIAAINDAAAEAQDERNPRVPIVTDGLAVPVVVAVRWLQVDVVEVNATLRDGQLVIELTTTLQD